MLCEFWIAMLFVFAYVVMIGFFGADILEAALVGKISSTSFTVNQGSSPVC